MNITGSFLSHCMTYGGSETDGAIYGESTGKMQSNGGSSGGHRLVFDASRNWYGSTSDNGSHAHSVTVQNTGGGEAHNNMPPYLVYYCWERTA